MHSYLFCILLVCPCCHAESNLSTRSLFSRTRVRLICCYYTLRINLSYHEILNSAKNSPYQVINYITHFQHALDMTILRKVHLNVRISFVSAYAYSFLMKFTFVFFVCFFSIDMNTCMNHLCGIVKEETRQKRYERVPVNSTINKYFRKIVAEQW